jgi:hypothetical protein
LAKTRGLKWVGPTVTSCLTKTTWQCARRHRFQTTYHSIQQGTVCPVCSGRQRKTPEDYRQMAAKRGWRWLGPEVTNVMTKTRWRCSLGHEWLMYYNDILQGHGCPICNSGRKTPAHYHQLAIECGLRWLGPEVPNVRTETRWRCSRGHRWATTYNAIQQGRGCPVCRKR